MYCHKSAYIEHRITSDLWSIHRELSRWLSGEDWILLFYRSISRQFQSPSETSHNATRLGTADQEYDLGLLLQTNKLSGGFGGARHSGNSSDVAETEFGVLPTSNQVHDTFYFFGSPS